MNLLEQQRRGRLHKPYQPKADECPRCGKRAVYCRCQKTFPAHKVYAGYAARIFAKIQFAMLLFMLTGCAVAPVQWSPVPQPTPKIPVALNPPAPITTRASALAVVKPPPPVRTNVTLAWDNPNPSADTKYMLTEFHSTTNLLRPFAFKCYVAAGLTNVTFKITNAAEFYICRFAQTNVTPWLRTEWNQ